MNKVRVGIVGIGNMGSVHAKSIVDGKIEGLQLVGVCDTDPKKLDWAKENLPDVACYSDFKELVDSKTIDAAIIATPHYFHSPMAIYAFENGLHVLSEKPAGVYTQQVRMMNEAAKKAGTVFSMMYNQRTNPMFSLAQKMVTEGQLGELKRCVWIITNWYRTQAYYNSGTWRATWSGEGGGVLVNQCPHNLDIWQWVFGMPKKVMGFCGYGKYHDIEVEDDVTAYAEYENGATAVFITTTGEFPGTNRLEISGDKGKIIIEDGKFKFWELGVPEREFNRTCEKGFAAPPTTYTEIVPEGVETGHNGILQNFTNAILKGEKLIAPGEEGINGLTISNSIHLSNWTNDWVELPIDEELYLKMLKEKIATSKTKDAVESKISDLQGTYNNRWDIKW